MADFLRLLAVFAVVTLLLRRRLNIGLVMLLGALTLAVLFQLSPLKMAETAWGTLSQFSTLNLVLALLLVIALENVMRTTGLLSRLIQALPALVGDLRAAMVLLPALVGFLPSPGGAMFSAPMVGDLAEGTPMTPEAKTFVNYWYRHMLEYVSPLAPAMILASQLAAVPIGSLIAAQLPLAGVALLVGLPVAFRGLGGGARTRPDFSKRNLFNLGLGLAPVAVVVSLVLAVHLEISLALGAVVAVLLIVFRYRPHQLAQLARHAFSLPIILLVLGVLYFKDVLVASGAIQSLPVFLGGIGFPPVALVCLVALVVGFLTGINQAPVGVSFPLLMGISAVGSAGPDLQLVALAYGVGFSGMMLTPAHLCFVLTAQYFKADLGRVVRMLVLPQLAIVAVAVLLYLVW